MVFRTSENRNTPGDLMKHLFLTLILLVFAPFYYAALLNVSSLSVKIKQDFFELVEKVDMSNEESCDALHTAFAKNAIKGTHITFKSYEMDIISICVREIYKDILKKVIGYNLETYSSTASSGIDREKDIIIKRVTLLVYECKLASFPIPDSVAALFFEFLLRFGSRNWRFNCSLQYIHEQLPVDSVLNVFGRTIEEFNIKSKLFPMISTDIRTDDITNYIKYKMLIERCFEGLKRVNSSIDSHFFYHLFVVIMDLKNDDILSLLDTINNSIQKTSFESLLQNPLTSIPLTKLFDLLQNQNSIIVNYVLDCTLYEENISNLYKHQFVSFGRILSTIKSLYPSRYNQFLTGISSKNHSKVDSILEDFELFSVLYEHMLICKKIESTFNSEDLSKLLELKQSLDFFNAERYSRLLHFDTELATNTMETIVFFFNSSPKVSPKFGQLQCHIFISTVEFSFTNSEINEYFYNIIINTINFFQKVYGDLITKQFDKQMCLHIFSFSQSVLHAKLMELIDLNYFPHDYNDFSNIVKFYHRSSARPLDYVYSIFSHHMNVKKSYDLMITILNFSQNHSIYSPDHFTHYLMSELETLTENSSTGKYILTEYTSQLISLFFNENILDKTHATILSTKI